MSGQERDSTASKGRGPVPAAVWFLLIAWLALTVAAVIWAVPHYEDHLGERTATALEGQPFEVMFAGRDAQLAGEVSDSTEIDKAMATLRAVHGVRRVTASGVAVTPRTGAASPEPETSPPEVVIAFSDGAVTFSGTVPDQATADAIIQAAETRWGSENVADRIRVGSNTPGAVWLPGIVTVVSSADALTLGSITVGPAGALVEGSVPTAENAAQVVATLETVFGPEVSVANQLQVVALNDPSFVAELLDDGTMHLSGVLPDQSTVDGIVAAAGGVYGSAAVVDDMVVGTGVASPDYLRALPGIFGAIEGLKPWRFGAGADGPTFSGLAVGATALADTLDRLEVLLGDVGLTVQSDAEVDPAAVASVLTDLLQGTATFKVGSAVLSTEATELLDGAIAILQDNTATVLTVEGHTDSVGTEDNNLALSEARAQAVVDYLVDGGIDAARLTAIGYGESRPIADNDTAEGRSQNRRIEFVVEEGENR